MFRYIFLIIGSELGQNKRIATIYEHILPDGSNVNISYVHLCHASNAMENENENIFANQREYSDSSGPQVLNSEPTYIDDIINFVKLMRTVYLYDNTFTVNENVAEKYDKAEIFNNLFTVWESEYHETSDKKIEKFSEQNKKKYRRNGIIISNYSTNFKKINNWFLPTIKIEIQNSTIQAESKRAIIDKIDNISRVMSYFAKLKPLYLRYQYNCNQIKLKHKLCLERFSYLFDYFNLCERFIELYELIIEQYIIVLPHQYKMNRTLFEMSKHLNYVFKKRHCFLTATQEILLLFQDHEASN
ncbi:uncharacterized protein VNE69_08168 [Vairimorpha necatrix]|uniref:Uncharacterized protein n=1 Tax=Vairimorpha necatrix TaxID=6039 RepID=A0AAX4JEK0_9MICR